MRLPLTSLLVIITCLLYGQGFNAGITAGGLISQVDGDNWSGYNKLGFQGGAYVYMQVSRHSTFQLELQYIQKGSRKNPDPEKGDYNFYLLRLHYMEVPLLYQFTFGRRWFAQAGPAADVLLGSYEETQDGEVPYNTVPLRNITLTGIAGIGCYLNHHLKLDFRFNYSLLSIRVPQPDGYPEGYRKVLFEYGQFNNVMSLSVAWDFKVRDF